MVKGSKGQDSVAAESGLAGPPLILLAKNEVLWRYRVAEALRSEGYRVVEATHGEEARTLLQLGLRPDLLISDVRMHGRVDGQGLGVLCRSLHPEVPILLAAPEMPVDFPENSTFLAKPYTFEGLIEAVQKLVGKK